MRSSAAWSSARLPAKLKCTVIALNKTPKDRTSRFPEVADRHLIFSINSGRSGSKYLAELFSTAEKVKSFHEAEPKMSGEFIEMINAQPLAVSREKRRIKAEAIAKILRGSGPDETYAETNHTFITAFFDVVLEDFGKIDIVILRRDLAHVLKSFIELGYFSPLNPLSLSWMSSPNAVTAALPAIGPDKALDQFDLCIAYLLDIEARTERFKKEYPDVRTHDVRLEELNKTAAVENLFQQLNLAPTDATRELCGRVSNERPLRKARAANPTTIDECRKRLCDYVEKAKALGIEIPASAAL
jgi:hypothetical protein